MRITRHNNCYLIRCTEHEFKILELANAQMAMDPGFSLPSSGLRRSWSRRTKDGPFLRIDRDKRT